MNKQELIEKYECMNRNLEMWVVTSRVLEDLKQLDEPQKVTVPQFVADWIEWTKKDGLDLQDAMNLISGEENEKLLRWFYNESNQETFARAWLDGYEVEKEKRYTVKMRATKQPLFYNSLEKRLFFSLGELATQFTFKQLEEAGFGWVFDCPLFEVEEVTE
ncbi:MAG: DUF1642 domain-containing protein [Streptococcus sp.]